MKRMSDKAAISEFKAALNRPAENHISIYGHASAAELIAKYSFDALPIMKAAAKGSKARAFTLTSIFLERGDEGCAVSDFAIREILADRAHVARDPVLGSMQRSEQKRFAPELREIAKHQTDPGWAYAVTALGDWRDLESVNSLISQTRNVETPFVLLQCLVKMRVPQAAPLFEANRHHPEARSRTFALWGLAALHHEHAVKELIALLDDPDVTTENSFQPGQSMRAAQALADVFKLEFNWGDQESLSKIKKYFRSKTRQA